MYSEFKTYIHQAYNSQKISETRDQLISDKITLISTPR